MRSEMAHGAARVHGGAFRPGVYQATVKLYIAGEQEVVLDVSETGFNPANQVRTMRKVEK